MFLYQIVTDSNADRKVTDRKVRRQIHRHEKVNMSRIVKGEVLISMYRPLKTILLFIQCVNTQVVTLRFVDNFRQVKSEARTHVASLRQIAVQRAAGILSAFPLAHVWFLLPL